MDTMRVRAYGSDHDTGPYMSFPDSRNSTLGRLPYELSVRHYSLYNPAPWRNGGGPRPYRFCIFSQSFLHDSCILQHSFSDLLICEY